MITPKSSQVTINTLEFIRVGYVITILHNNKAKLKLRNVITWLNSNAI